MDLTLLSSARSSEATLSTWTGRVVRSDTSGIWVAPVGSTTRHPIGPCRGGWIGAGRRVGVGELVQVTFTQEAPWVSAIDSPPPADDLSAPAAPFTNADFEDLGPDGKPLGWSDFWSSAAGGYEWDLDPSFSYTGKKSLKVAAQPRKKITLTSTAWSVIPGASITIDVAALGAGSATFLKAQVLSNTAAADPMHFNPGTVVTDPVTWALTPQWTRRRLVVSIPPSHSRVRLGVEAGSSDDAPATVWVDNIRVTGGELSAADHGPFIRRAQAAIGGGGTRTTTAGGNVAWSLPFVVEGVGVAAHQAAAGRFEVAMPPDTTVIPVKSSNDRTSVVVAGGVLGLFPGEALYYNLPLGEAAASQPDRFVVVGSSLADGWHVPDTALLIVRRASWGASYRWGDGLISNA